MKPGISVRFPVDLRMAFDIKINDASKHYSWTAYINNAGTLCHLIQPNTQILVRIKFYGNLKFLSHKAMAEVIKRRLSHYINL